MHGEYSLVYHAWGREIKICFINRDQRFIHGEGISAYYGEQKLKYYIWWTEIDILCLNWDQSILFHKWRSKYV